nr:hypothetical transcript [Hymenolepis microstoma]
MVEYSQHSNLTSSCSQGPDKSTFSNFSPPLRVPNLSVEKYEMAGHINVSCHSVSDPPQLKQPILGKILVIEHKFFSDESGKEYTFLRSGTSYYPE